MNIEQLKTLSFKVLVVERAKGGRWWNYKQVISPFARIWLVMGGRASVSHHGRRYEFVPGSMHLLPAYSFHDYFCSQMVDLYFIHFTCRLSNGRELFSAESMDYEIREFPEAASLFRRLDGIYPERKLPVYDPLEKEYRRHSARMDASDEGIAPADFLEAQGIMRLLVAPFLRTVAAPGGKNQTDRQRFAQVEELVNRNMGRALTLRDLAESAGLNPTYFSNLFTRVFGESPMKYLMRRRLEHAQSLLVTTHKSIKEIAVEVGIPDPGYFCRVFHRTCRMPPSDYRVQKGV
jgi:AraC-like DNA-binding protein